MKKFTPLAIASLTCLFLLNSRSEAANPIVKGYADPAMRVVDGKMYIAIGKDKSPELKDFIMPSWSIISSSNLVDWKTEATIDPSTTFLGAGYLYCWASDLTFRNGKWYFYFSKHGEETGVLVADKIQGPYVDVLKKPLLTRETTPDNRLYDPTIFTDDDGQNYLVAGRDGMLQGKLVHYQIAKLAHDLVSLAEKPRDLLTDQPFGFGSAKLADDHSYFHKHNGIYYLSKACFYMTSSNIYGPFSNPRSTGQRGHTSFCDFNGQSYHAWEWTCDPYGNRMYRQVMLTYLHYKDNGDMVDEEFFLKGHPGYDLGVGNYDANWEKIQAEWFFNKSAGITKKDCPEGGFEIQGIKDGDFLCFPSVKNLAANTPVSFRISSANPSGGQIEIRADSATGPLLGTCKIAGTGSWKSYQTVSTSLKNPAGTSNLFLVFKGGKAGSPAGGGEMAHLNWLSFRPVQNENPASAGALK